MITTGAKRFKSRCPEYADPHTHRHTRAVTMALNVSVHLE